MCDHRNCAEGCEKKQPEEAKRYKCFNCGREFSEEDWVLEDGELVYRCPDCLTVWYKEEPAPIEDDYENFPFGYLGNMYYVEEEKRLEEEEGDAKKALMEANAEFIETDKPLFDAAENSITALLKPMKFGPRRSMATAIKEYVNTLVDRLHSEDSD